MTRTPPDDGGRAAPYAGHIADDQLLQALSRALVASNPEPEPTTEQQAFAIVRRARARVQARSRVRRRRLARIARVTAPLLLAAGAVTAVFAAT